MWWFDQYFGFAFVAVSFAALVAWSLTGNRGD